MLKRIGLVGLAAFVLSLFVPTTAAAQGAGAGDRRVFAGVTFVHPSNINIVVQGGLEIPRGAMGSGSLSIPVGAFFVDGPDNTFGFGGGVKWIKEIDEKMKWFVMGLAGVLIWDGDVYFLFTPAAGIERALNAKTDLIVQVGLGGIRYDGAPEMGIQVGAAIAWKLGR